MANPLEATIENRHLPMALAAFGALLIVLAFTIVPAGNGNLDTPLAHMTTEQHSVSDTLIQVVDGGFADASTVFWAGIIFLIFAAVAYYYQK